MEIILSLLLIGAYACMVMASVSFAYCIVKDVSMSIRYFIEQKKLKKTAKEREMIYKLQVKQNNIKTIEFFKTFKVV